MDSRIVVAVYRPHPGKRDELLKQIKRHVPTLRRLALATDRAETLMTAEDGSLVEVFEWASEQASRMAHEHPEVAQIWEAMGAVCSFGSLADLAEASRPFCHFTPLALS